MICPTATRILVTGGAGAGKTTLARALAISRGLPYHCLDPIVWEAGWRKRPPADKDVRIADLVTGDRWVIDGVADDAMRSADLVIFLDVPRRVAPGAVRAATRASSSPRAPSCRPVARRSSRSRS